MTVMFIDGPISGLEMEVPEVPEYFRFYASGRLCVGSESEWPDMGTEICVYRRAGSSVFCVSHEDFTRSDEEFLKGLKISLDEPTATSQRTHSGCNARDERGSV